MNYYLLTEEPTSAQTANAAAVRKAMAVDKWLVKISESESQEPFDGIDVMTVAGARSEVQINSREWNGPRPDET